jgi:hypothetical protein
MGEGTIIRMALHQYELKHLAPDFKPGKPAPFSLRKP